MTAKKATLVIKNIGQLITCAGGLKQGDAMNSLGLLSGIDIVCTDETIAYIGKEPYPELELEQETVIVDASGKVVMPGFVDCHTHLIFAGDRVHDWKIRMGGSSYQAVAQKGGGIMSTVTATRSASEEDLYNSALSRLSLMLHEGTTSCEIKSGYGLDFDTEIKLLKIANRLKNHAPADIAVTFLGAHAVPAEYKQKQPEYVNLVINNMIPYVSEQKLADFCDVFCDVGYFSIEESHAILQAGKQHGLVPKIHADELAYTGGAELAAELGAISAEHLLFVSKKGITSLAHNNVIAVLLPTTSFFLKSPKSPARDMLQQNVAIALATDFNPGTSFCYSMLFVITLACYYYDMTVEEAISASTINAAYATGKGTILGSLEAGKQADCLIFNVPHYDYLVYQCNTHKPAAVIKKGKLIT